MAKYLQDNQGRYYMDRRIGGKRCMIRGKSCAEIDRKLKQWLAKQVVQQKEKALGPMFESVAVEWYHSAEKRLSYSTLVPYKARLDAALDEFSGLRIAEIRPVDVTRLYEKMVLSGYSSKTISHQRTVLRNIFRYWNLRDGTDHNPALSASMPKGKCAVERQPVCEAAISAVLQHTNGFGIVPCLFAFTGARLGEVMALQVQDVDLDKSLYGCHGSINIGKSVQWQSGRPVIKTPKTDAGIRCVPIFDKFRPILLSALEGLEPDDYIVSRCSEPLTAHAYERRWALYCRQIGFAKEVKIASKRPQHNEKTYMITEWRPTITAHQFRHLMATACVEANIPEYVAQKILGHKSIQTTLKHYTHIREKMLEKSYSNLNQVYEKITQN